jgi:O-antigen ligase
VSRPSPTSRRGDGRATLPVALLLIAVVLMPVADRYLVSLVVPDSLRTATNFLSEALLLVAVAIIGLRSWRNRTLGLALRHPVTWLAAGFAIVAAASAVANGVPPLIAMAGIGFTIEAVALFVLPRMAGVDIWQARLALIGFAAVALVAAILALAQVVLDANFLGLQSFTGRFSEGHRVAAFLVNPNMLGAVLAMAIPMPLLAAVRAEGRHRLPYAAATFVLALALLYTFSRGAWLGLALAGVVLAVAVDWRVLVGLALVAILALATAAVLPRHVLDPDPADPEFALGPAIFGRLGTISEGTDLRLQFITNASQIIADHPLLGAGPGRYGGAVAWRFGSPLYDQYTDGSVPEGRTVDNFWLHLLAEVGVLGTLLFGAALALATWQALRTARASSGWSRIVPAAAASVAIVIAVDSATEMLLEGNTTSFATWFFLGLASAVAAGPAARQAAGAAGDPAASRPRDR